MSKKKCTSLLILLNLSLFLISCGTNNEAKKDQTIKEVKTNFEFEKSATLSGTLQTLTYENLAGNKLETYILILDRSISVESKKTDISSQNNIKEVQVGFSDLEKTGASFLNKKITIKGILYPEQTVNDRRPVIMVNALILK